MGADPYAGHDPQNTRRFAGLMWVVFAAAVLATTPVVEIWALPAAVGVVFGSIGIALLRNAPASYATLLRLSFLALATTALLQRAAGDDAGLYQELYLVVALHTASVHPPKRIAVFLVALTACLCLAADRAGWTGETIADTGVHLAIIVLVSLISSKLVKELREQRLSARTDEARAQVLAATDALTGLGNRRRLVADLEDVLRLGAPHQLILLDLDGFKAYNDGFGHPAGDALLQRLGVALAAAVDGRGTAYRMGGDEFCVLAPSHLDVVGDVLAALTEHGDGFSVTASHGAVEVPAEAATPSAALGVADRRMYSCKRSGRASAGRQTTDVLLSLLNERDPELGTHVHDVERTCERVAVRLGLPDEDIAPLLQAAALHDIGKAAIPDAILDKPEPLDEHEWAFIRRHTLIGERILLAAPALRRAAAYVRASHERYDGGGYPDALGGEEIPLGARIIAVCDAFEAMTSDRAYRRAMSVPEALAELRRCAGTQFDPLVVAALCATVGEDAASAASAGAQAA